jgi:23S rRNA (guanine745-N1)-methyltransferase
MRPDVVDLLSCPHCGAGLAQAGSALRCPRSHSFDIARQGYVNLLPAGSRTDTADNASMVQARDAFLKAGHFAGLLETLAETTSHAAAEADRATPAVATGRAPARGCVIDVGTGTGYYLAGVLDRLPDRVGLALDLSKFALRRAARAHERIGAVACDVWRRLPVRDGSAAIVLDVFAPRNPPEFARVLEADGRLIVVTPTRDHLRELVSSLGLLTVDQRKQERLSDTLAAYFTPTESAGYEGSLALAPEEVMALVRMGPSAHHLRTEELADRVTRLAATPRSPSAEMTVTASVTVSVYRLL